MDRQTLRRRHQKERLHYQLYITQDLIVEGTRVLGADLGLRTLSLTVVKSMAAIKSKENLRTSIISFNAIGRLHAIRKQLIKPGYTMHPIH